MKKRNLLYAALIVAVVVALSSCFHHGHDIVISVNDDDDEYRMRASFDADRTGEVERIINRHLREHHSDVVVRVFSDREISFDDGTNLNVKINPGRLKINIENQGYDGQTCNDLREMCEEIKEVIARERNNE